jgi:hypothetical protein
MCRIGRLAQTQGCHNWCADRRESLQHNALRFENVDWLSLEDIGSVGLEVVVDNH